MVYFVYILQSRADDSFYKGITDNLARRFDEHNAGKDSYTKLHIPWDLIWYTTKESRAEAFRLERKVKNLSVQRTLEFIRKYPVEDSLVGVPDVTQPRQSGC
ncbi:MAG: GIY-YIG nuclease family protein [Cyclobacteriaceae bacterium]|nr:GIY-YIG nuclease family protein [Cyclobacteriaceae bacterium]